MWVYLGLIILTLFLLCQFNDQETYIGLDPSIAKNTVSAQQDFPVHFNNYHKYPFTKYSLYGYDDYSPYYRYLWEQDQKNPYQQTKEREWQLIKDRRRLGRQYIQMPSYNHVRQLGYTN